MFAPFLDTGMHSEMYTHVAKSAGNNFIIGITFNKVPSPSPIAHYRKRNCHSWLLGVTHENKTPFMDVSIAFMDFWPSWPLKFKGQN